MYKKRSQIKLLRLNQVCSCRKHRLYCREISIALAFFVFFWYYQISEEKFEIRDFLKQASPTNVSNSVQTPKETSKLQQPRRKRLVINFNQKIWNHLPLEFRDSLIFICSEELRKCFFNYIFHYHCCFFNWGPSWRIQGNSCGKESSHRFWILYESTS